MRKEECQKIFELICSKTRADVCECLVDHEEECLSRFANSTIHQNVRSVKTGIRLRLIQGNKSGFSATNDTSEKGLQQLVVHAETTMNNNEENKEPYELPQPAQIHDIPFSYFDHSQDFDSPQKRADFVQMLCKGALKHQVSAFGNVSTTKRTIFVGNTYGVSAYHQSTQAKLSSQMMKDEASGFAQSSSSSLQDLEVERVLEDSLWGCLNSVHVKTIEAKPYEVILKPEAVEDILQMLNYMGFFSNAIIENRSFLSGREGEQIFDPSISIKDNTWDYRQIPLPFDFEGAPRQMVPLIEKGIFKQMVTDARISAKLNIPNTGHALPAPNPHGPVPIHLILEGENQQDLESMIQNCREGLLITRFWYANPAHPKKGVATGLTRDGTFLVQNGKIQHAVHNLRYTDSLVKVLSNVIASGNITRLYNHMLTPALHCASMNFTGQASK